MTRTAPTSSTALHSAHHRPPPGRSRIEPACAMIADPAS